MRSIPSRRRRCREQLHERLAAAPNVLAGGCTVLVLRSLLVNLGLEYQDWWHPTL